MQTSANRGPWPHQIRDVETRYMGPETWDRLQRLNGSGNTQVFQGQTFLITGGAFGISEKLFVVAASIIDIALPINRGKHGIGVYNIGGVHIPEPY